MSAESKLIIDIGMSEGNDTQFYLRKGFYVVGIEADPVAVAGLQERFSSEISGGRLCLMHRAAAATNGEIMSFWRNTREQGHSSLNQTHSYGDKERFEVCSINWPSLRSIVGVPYYLKIDIEGGELPFLGSMLGSMELPTFISVECHAFAPIESLFAIGYRRFKLVNQTILYALPVPNPALEGIYVPDPDWRHASGPFGRELPGDWFDLAGIALQFDAIMRMKSLKTIIHPHVWFDCHAWQV